MISLDSTEAIRAYMRQQRAALPEDTIRITSEKACQRLLTLESFASAQKIAVYMPLYGEVLTQTLINTAWRQNKQVHLPVLDEQHALLFAPYLPDSTLRLNRYRIAEPETTSGSPPLRATQLDLIVIPLVAFDQQCNRIGMGAGYYDRALAVGLPGQPARIGLAYEFQCVAAIAARPWDIPMDIIVTEDRTYHQAQIPE